MITKQTEGIDTGHGTAPAVLDAADVCAFYGKIQVVFDISLAVKDGECLAVLGPNGAGKSSLLGVLSGLVHGSGTVRVNGEVISGLGPHIRAKKSLSFVPEARKNLFMPLSVRENIALGLRLSVAAERRRTEAFLLELFPALEQRLSAAAGSLSGGEQQMLAVAVALGRNPQVLALDEPSQGLAPAVYDVLEDAFVKLKAERVAILLAEQSLPFASRVADRHLVLVGGRAVAEGGQLTVEEIGSLQSAYLG